MPVYLVTRADGTTDTLTARDDADALARSGDWPEVESVTRLERIRGRALAHAKAAYPELEHVTDLADQPRLLAADLDLAAGVCPLPGCGGQARDAGELHSHMLVEHGWSPLGEGK